MERWLWLCPVLGLLGAAVALWVFGLGWLAALGIAFLVSCPAIVLWTLREARTTFRLRDRLLDEIPRSRRKHG